MMNHQTSQSGEGIKKGGVIAVAIDREKGSQYALKWAVDHVLSRGQTVTLLHVKPKQTINSPFSSPSSPLSGAIDDITRSIRSTEPQARELFIPYRCFCSKKDIQCNEVILEDNDISKALIDYTLHNGVEIMVVSASQKNGLLRRFKGPDVATNLAKGCPEFCSVYVISKTKMLYVRSATRTLPKLSNASPTFTPNSQSAASSPSIRDSTDTPFKLAEENLTDTIRSPFTRGKAANGRAYGELGMPDCDISFVGGTPPWANPDRTSGGTPPWATPDRTSGGTPPWATPDRTSSGTPPWATPERQSFERPSFERSSFERSSFERPSLDLSEFSSRFSSAQELERMSIGSSMDRRSIDEYSGSLSSGYSISSMNPEEIEEMRRLKQELKQTMDMYNAACKEAMAAKKKASEIQRTHAHSGEEAVVEQEKARSKAAIQAKEAAQKLADLEAQRKLHAEKKANRETDEKKGFDSLGRSDVRYRKYSIGEVEAATKNFSESLKIGEGGYGPVYRGYLDHTPAAIKVLRADAAQGEEQFHQEVEILSCIRHPNMVLLLGACPEYGCLVYEYMSNGSLEDRLSCKGNSPPLPWQIRFRIAAEIATGLLFLHQTKPEPLVHRDLKPANILLDRNYVSKISDVGLARLVPPAVADSVTEYRMTQAAGTFCYIDPEYQQTGMLGTKSDIYSLGILYLQLITARPAMGLTHHVQRAIERGTFKQMLDPTVHDWPYEEALEFAKISLWCAEMRRKDRPDLNKVLPEIERLRDFAEDNIPHMY